MSNWIHAPAFDFGPGFFALIVFGAGAVSALLVMLIVGVLRRAGRSEMTNALWGAGLVLAGVACGALLIGRVPWSDARNGRRGIEQQAAELTARAMAPGSALACLDAAPNAVTEACGKSLFATPEALAVALDYVDAKLQLLEASSALAERDSALRPSVERLRNAIEADPFGLVSHVLTTRGCSSAECNEIKLLRDPARVLANMRAHTLDSYVGLHTAAWGGGLAAPPTSSIPGAPSPSAPAPTALNGGPTVAPLPTTSGTSSGGKFDFPSAASIPPVSIMNAEPSGPPPKSETASPPVPPKRPPQPRRQTAREQSPGPPAAAATRARPAQPAAPSPPPPAQSAAPAQATPEPAPEVVPEQPRTSNTY